VTQELYDHAGPQWSPDGQWLGATQYRMNGMDSRLVLLPLAAGEQHQPREIAWEHGTIGPWSWSPNGDRVILAGDTEGTPQLDFFVHDMASGETRKLTDDLQIQPSSGDVMGGAPATPVWLDERQVLFNAVRAGGSGLHVIDAAGGAVEPVATFQALHAGLSVDAERRYAVQSGHSAEHTSDISVYDLKANTQTTITSLSAELLAEAPSAKPERITVQRGEYEVEAWLLHPPDFDPNKRYPLIIDIHGGPHGFYGYGFYPWQQVLATHGFLVVYANPRGSGSYGRKFGMAVRHDWGGEDYLDLMAVVDKVLERPYADPARTGMRGYSYGGYMTSWILGQTDRFAACCCGAPCFDFESFWGTSDIGHYFGEKQFGDAPWRAKEAYAKHSPSAFIHNATTPTLIIHGEGDMRCPIGQGEQLYISLLRNGVETEFVRYPGADHLFLIYGWPEHRADFWTRELAWFTKHLQPEATA
jgi:dipeptidyl aminopeptidase/acylaminoacyl peptidase